MLVASRLSFVLHVSATCKRLFKLLSFVQFDDSIPHDRSPLCARQRYVWGPTVTTVAEDQKDYSDYCSCIFLLDLGPQLGTSSEVFIVYDRVNK